MPSTGCTGGFRPNSPVRVLSLYQIIIEIVSFNLFMLRSKYSCESLLLSVKHFLSKKTLHRAKGKVWAFREMISPHLQSVNIFTSIHLCTQYYNFKSSAQNFLRFLCHSRLFKKQFVIFLDMMEHSLAIAVNIVNKIQRNRLCVLIVKAMMRLTSICYFYL